MTTMRGFVHMENIVDLAFKWASLHGWDRKTEQSDAKLAVEAVLATPPDEWRAHPTFLLFEQCDCVFVVWINRSGNKVAHEVARWRF
ncbi:hypothetical protein TIFTF001_006680 [Ficus carica]|uniref:RNase H type-1 domain-containing protein n=1 Tax=Ficus carica TaxID=3494 RepID=A0AA87ZHW8_FICCA|nr:hypothetical protein TIFTF001_006680 [Ficus carica]